MPVGYESSVVITKDQVFSQTGSIQWEVKNKKELLKNIVPRSTRVFIMDQSRVVSTCDKTG